MATASAPPAPRTSQGRWPRWVPIAGWTVLGILGATLLVFIATVTFGAVHGTEFCPQTFERRSYSYYEIPLVRWQITGEKHEDLTGATEKTITSNNLLPAPPGPKKDWHVLMGSRGTRLRRPGDAGILMQYLDATEGDSGMHRWDNWTEHDKTKDLANVLWPAVQQLALRERYIFVPDLFDLAKNYDDPKALQAEINRTLANRLLFVAQMQSQLGNGEAALKLLGEAAAFDPENASITQTKAKLETEKPTAEVEPPSPGN
jgi:hypothetical protein